MSPVTPSREKLAPSVGKGEILLRKRRAAVLYGRGKLDFGWQICELLVCAPSLPSSHSARQDKRSSTASCGEIISSLSTQTSSREIH